MAEPKAPAPPGPADGAPGPAPRAGAHPPGPHPGAPGPAPRAAHVGEAAQAAPARAADTAAVVAAHDGERWIAELLASVVAQTVRPAVVVVVDDGSRDRTRDVVRAFAASSPVPVELVEAGPTRARDPKTRVARTVSRGLVAARGHAVLVLADQDDTWLPGRLAAQRRVLVEDPGALLVAGDGVLVDADGAPLGGRLRDRFPVPGDWGLAPPAARMRDALRIPFVTGSAMALTAECAALVLPVPRGWLHDRWATLVATARDGLRLQVEPVIRYRLHPGQLLGDRQAAVGAGRPRWRQVLDRGATPLAVLRRARDVSARVRPLADDPAVADELGWPALVRSALYRV